MKLNSLGELFAQMRHPALRVVGVACFLLLMPGHAVSATIQSALSGGGGGGLAVMGGVHDLVFNTIIVSNNALAGEYDLYLPSAAASPCINSGTNQSRMTGAVDLDGRARIDRFSGLVDIGCYEYLPKGSVCQIR